MSLLSVKIEKWLSIAQQNVWIRQRESGNPEDICALETPLNE